MARWLTEILGALCRASPEFCAELRKNGIFEFVLPMLDLDESDVMAGLACLVLSNLVREESCRLALMEKLLAPGDVLDKLNRCADSLVRNVYVGAVETLFVLGQVSAVLTETTTRRLLRWLADYIPHAQYYNHADKEMLRRALATLRLGEGRLLLPEDGDTVVRVTKERSHTVSEILRAVADV